MTTLERATSFLDRDGGFISPEEGADRVFRAAIHHGCFRVNWDVRNGTRRQIETRSFPVAVYLSVRLIEEGERPLLYAATYNRDALISARAYRDTDGEWINGRRALADVYQRYLDMWADEFDLDNVPAPILNKLRPRRRIKRERL